MREKINALKKHLPTIPSYIERRKQTKANRLPKHLRTPEGWPLYVQMLLNGGLVIALVTLILNKDDYLSDAGPAITLIVCLLTTIYTLVEARILRKRYHKIRGERLAKINVGLSILALVVWAATIAFYLP